MSCTFTVFTATYNRSHTLERLWRSLVAQSFTDFEWLIVDDGSTDGTAELVERLRKRAKVVIRYFRQENGGKHVAFDRAVDLAEGLLFLPVDSDDELVPHALARLWQLWREIPADRADRFAGITAACATPEGGSVGPPLPTPVLDCSALDAVFRWRVAGERFGFQRTQILRQIRFPVGREFRFVPEGVLWFAIGRRYLTRFVADALRVYYTDGPDRLSTATLERKAPGLAYFSRDLLLNYTDYAFSSPLAFLKAGVQYLRFRRHLAHAPPRSRLGLVAWLFIGLAATPAMVFAVLDRIGRSQ